MSYSYRTGQRPFEGFTIKRGIGRGGFGEVYFALSDAGKEVALKCIQCHPDIELRGISQSLNLKHPNLVHLYDLRTDADGTPWLIMEYVAGEPLSNILSKNPNGVGLDLACVWFAGLSSAVHYLHDHGIVHRDLKPGNIFLEQGTIKIGDYGLCKYMGNSQRVGQSESIGSVHYMAPEISSGNYNRQIDIYAAGVIFYEMLTGSVPFDGQSPAEILMKHLTAPVSLTRIPTPAVPILERALCKNPTNRFTSIGEMGKEVAALIDTDKIIAKAFNPPVSERKPASNGSDASLAKRERMVELGQSLVFTVLLAVVFATAWAFMFLKGQVGLLVPGMIVSVACSWTVLIASLFWTKPLDDSGVRRLSLMGIGMGIGLLASWLAGYPGWLTHSNATAAVEVSTEPRVQRVFESLYPDENSLPFMVGFASYFGLMFLTVRWWKLVEEGRAKRFDYRPVLAVGFWAFVFLFLLPKAERHEAFVSQVLTAAIVQIVSPWTPESPQRSKKLRLQEG